jgi:hypothetical protein
LIEIADEVILITDHTKFGQGHGFLVAAPAAFSKIITNTQSPPEDVQVLRAAGVEVILVEPAEDATILRPVVMGTFAGESGEENYAEFP